jgi:NTE family protein
MELAETPTRLKRLDDERQERLINWGYAVCDAALRAHVDPSLARADKFPYPAVEV